MKPTRSLRYLVRQMLLIGCALLMAGCGGVEEAPAADLAGTRWALTSLDGDGLIEGTEITLTFEEAFLGGKMTCNGYGGTPDGGKVTVGRDGSFRVELLAVTVQLCSEPEGIMEQEAAYISALHSGTAYRVIDDRLKILDAEGEAILVFDREISARQGNQTPQRAIRKLRLAA